MTIQKHIIVALAAIIMLTTGAIASAQTTTGTGDVTVTATTTTGTTDTTGSVTTPGTPNTGAGGDALFNWMVLAVTGTIVLAGLGYLSLRPAHRG